MTSEERLAEVVRALESVGISCLVMGGHAVRYYGLVRNTNDFDLSVSPDPWDDLRERLARSVLFRHRSVVEGPSWRTHSFRRFQVGELPDGRPEWLELWRENHLLAPYRDLARRCEVGSYGGQAIAFLGLADLIRSKETERDADWQDMAVLEEIQDARLLARAQRGEIPLEEALGSLRSRAGFASYLQAGLLRATERVSGIVSTTRNPITQAFLVPFAPTAKLSSDPAFAIEPVILGRLRKLAGASPLHLSLVEVIRRRYIRFRKEADRADKEALRSRLK